MMKQYNARKQWLVSVFEDTMQKIRCDAGLQQAVSESIHLQQFVAEKAIVSLPEPRYTESAQVIVTKNRSFEAAAKYNGQKVAVLNFASSTNPGGGVKTGASAQEECLCRVSALYPCLNDQRMWNLFYSPHRAARNPLHNDDIIYTPNVVVLKDDDYNDLPTPFEVDVITCAAPNLREQPSNPYNTHDGANQISISPQDLLALHEQRGRKILSVAAQQGAEVVILGALGCGAFQNDPEIVARAYKNILPEFAHYFKTIEFSVYCRPSDDSNYRAFNEIVKLR